MCHQFAFGCVKHFFSHCFCAINDIEVAVGGYFVFSVLFFAFFFSPQSFGLSIDGLLFSKVLILGKLSRCR